MGNVSWYLSLRDSLPGISEIKYDELTHILLIPVVCTFVFAEKLIRKPLSSRRFGIEAGAY